MINPTIASTRSGGPIAAAFATLRFIGEDGYVRLAGLTADAVRGLGAAVSHRGRSAADGRTGVDGGGVHFLRTPASISSCSPTS
jgi:glutamate/tyrosine decarboxylase-like PLP-dependent enzyme